MAEIVSKNTFDSFKKITKVDAKLHLEEFISFSEEGAINIFNYYGGKLESYPVNSFETLSKLKKENIELIEIFIANAETLVDYEYWVLLELIEDESSKLNTIGNWDKWLRSPKKNDQFGSSIELDYVLKQGQTLEDVAENVQTSDDPQQDWVNIALRNELTEEDYSLEGGTIIKLSFENGNTIFLNSVVDNINTVDKTFGLDIDRIITFDAVTSDLKVLTPAQTIEQSAEINLGLKLGDNPFHPNDGLDVKNGVGRNIISVAYPIIVRQIKATFAKDDTFTSITLTRIDRERDGVRLTFDIGTKAGEVLSKGVLLS